MDIVTLATYSSTVQADLAKVYLESEGVACFVADSATSNLKVFGGVPSGVRLQVYADDLERAQETLRRFEAQNPSEFDEEALMAAFEEDAADRNVPIDEIPEDRSIRDRPPNENQEEGTDSDSDSNPTCPQCGSWRIVRERDLGFLLTLLTVLLVGLPLLFIRPQLRCQKCGYHTA